MSLIAFKDEMIAFLKKHNLPFDERYIQACRPSGA
jgi:hypothetical protein